MNTTSLPPRALSAERPRLEAAEAMAGSGMPEPPLLAEEVFSAVLEKTLQGDKAIAPIEASPEQAPALPQEALDAAVVAPALNELAQPLLTPMPPPSTLIPEGDLTKTTPQAALAPITAQRAMVGSKNAAEMSEPSPADKASLAQKAIAEPFSALLSETMPAHEQEAIGSPETPPPSLASPPAMTRLAEPSPPAQPTPSLPVPVMALPAAIGIKALEGSHRFDIRLDPEDLGRVDIALEIDQDGSIRAAISVEKPEALQLITREARALEQAFDQAGFRRDENALSFNLSDQGQSSENPSHRPEKRTMTRLMVEGNPDLAQPLEAALMRTHGRLDMRI